MHNILKRVYLGNDCVERFKNLKLSAVYSSGPLPKSKSLFCSVGLKKKITIKKLTIHICYKSNVPPKSLIYTKSLKILYFLPANS